MILLILSGAVLFSTRAQQQTADSLDYALSARTGLGMYHPHHLLYIPIVRLFLTGLSILGGSGDPILAGQVHNVLWAMVTTLCFFIVARRLLDSVSGAFLAAVFLLVMRGFWLYSTQLEVYIPSTGCLALMTVLLMGRPRDLLPAGRLLLLSLLLALAVLYHQSNLFFCIPLGYFLVGEGGRGWKRLWVLAPAGGLVLSAYLLAFRYADVETRIPEILSTAQKSSFEGFLRFCLAYRYHPSPGWGTWRNISVMGVGRLIHSQIRDVITFPWALRFLVIPGFGLLMAGLALWNARQSARGATHASARRFLVIWLLTYDLFFLWWFPGEKEFFITLLYPLLLLAALAVRDYACAGQAGTRRRTYVGGGCVALLACVAATNASETIGPYHRDRGPAYAASSLLAGRIPADCLVIGDYSVGQNLRYYFGRERFWETAMPLFYFYQDLPLPRLYRLEGEKCVVADLSFVSPAYSLGGFDARHYPRQWSRFLEWVLGMESGSLPHATSCREFVTLGDIEGSAYVRLSQASMPVQGVEPLFRLLDDAMGGDAPGDRPFEKFLSTGMIRALP